MFYYIHDKSHDLSEDTGGLLAVTINMQKDRYDILILSFIRNSLVPESEHLCFYCYARAFLESMCSCDCHNMAKKGPFASFRKAQ